MAAINFHFSITTNSLAYVSRWNSSQNNFGVFLLDCSLYKLCMHAELHNILPVRYQYLHWNILSKTCFYSSLRSSLKQPDPIGLNNEPPCTWSIDLGLSRGSLSNSELLRHVQRAIKSDGEKNQEILTSEADKLSMLCFRHWLCCFHSLYNYCLQTSLHFTTPTNSGKQQHLN